MLSREDERRLAEIEEHLEAADPQLAAFMRNPDRRRGRWALLACLAVWATVIVAALAGLWIIAVIVAGPLIAITVLAWETARSSRHATP